MGRKRDRIPTNKRKRALYSCDRCKQRKRACKRYQDNVRIFDNTTPCENCLNTNSECTTELPRKKRSYFSVSETTLIQFKCLTLIIQAMFPESDPNNLDHIKNIAKALFVTLPKYELSKDFDGVDGNSDSDDNHYIYDDFNDIGDENNNLLMGSMLPEKKTVIINASNEAQIGLGGADRLFNALLQVGKAESSNINQETYMIRNVKLSQSPPLLINGNNIQKSLLLNLIPQQECQMYINVFFNRLHESYFIFNEKKFKKRHELFLKKQTTEKLDVENTFCNEEICSIYLVWILGRNCYLTKLLQVDDPSKANVVSNSVIEKYAEILKICLSGCFYSSNIHCIRMLYLMSLYHSTIKNRELAWHLLSNCCLKCISMGYHRNSIISKYSDSEQEDIKVVLWSSFKLHMNNCAINGSLPNISLYEVNIDLPRLEYVEDKLFRDTYTKSIELFKLMFNILKNREYLAKSKNPWCKENLRNIIKISTHLKLWENGLGFSVKYYERPNPKRFQIKLHLQYYYCFISLIAPYLIAYALNPKRSFESSTEIIEVLCDGVNCAVQLMKVIKFSVNSGYCNGLLHYDLFYSYNALMILLLGYSLLKKKSKDSQNEYYNQFANILSKKFGIDMETILKTIKEIREINNYYGADAIGTMRDFSNNITTLLKYFKLNEDHSTIPSNMTTGIYNNSEGIDLTYIENTTLYNDNQIDRNIELEEQSNEFFDFIKYLSTEGQEDALFFNDQLLSDWNKMFSEKEMGFCDH